MSLRRGMIGCASVAALLAAACSGSTSETIPSGPSATTAAAPTTATTVGPSSTTSVPSSSAPTTTASPGPPPDPAAIDATVELLAELGGPLAATTEVATLVAYGGDLWASTSQWMAPEPVGGALLRHTPGAAGWEVVLQTDQLRMMALQRFTVPGRHAGGAALDVLLAQVRADGVSELRWAVGGSPELDGAFVLPDVPSDARSLGAHDEGEVFAFYAGVRPTGLLRGEWDPVGRTIVWSGVPELVVAGEGLDQKVTGFASCGGAVWVTVRTSLYRRTDGPLADGAARWVEVFRDPETNADNSGLRGITCVRRSGGDALLFGREGPGTMLRVDDLDLTASTVDPVVEVDIRALVSDTLQRWGHEIPAAGQGAVGYVIPAYNDLVEVADGAHLTGVEWSYELGGCPTSRPCQPQRTFDAQACLLRRVDPDGRDAPQWSLWCLAGDALPAVEVDDPVIGGQAFVAVRALQVAPWAPDELWVAGYDANFVPSIGTGWAGRVRLADLLGAQE